MQQNKRSLVIAAWIILASFVSLTAATYAWMSIASFYEVSDLDLTVVTENALEIAPDVNGAPGVWSKVMATEQLIAPDDVLRPVTWSAADKAFYAPTYGLDGRISFLSPHKLTDLSDTDIQAPSANEEGEGDGYLIAIDFWMRTGASSVTTYLTGEGLREPDRMGEGTYVMGVPVWDADAVCHKNGGKGAEAVIRIGFMTYDESYDDGRFYIYEPNTSADEEPTLGMNGEPLEGDGKLITQNPSTFTEQDPVLHGSVNYQKGTFITQDTEMFRLVSDTPRRVTLFIWLEGQDAQCNNTISAGAIIANLQIGATADNHDQDIIRPEGGETSDEQD